jgi:hypothetical protein
MKKIFSIFLLAVFLSGCATYKFQKGQAPYDKGYVASRDGYAILEYTVGQDKGVPADIALAKQRFAKRRRVVEDYYKKMDAIENRFKMAVWDPAAMFVKLIAGVFRLPFIALSDYKYDHNPAYREKVRRLEEEKDLREEARLAKLKERLSSYIQQVLLSEAAGPSQKAELVAKELSRIEKTSAQPGPAAASRIKMQTAALDNAAVVSEGLDKAQQEQRTGRIKQQPPEEKPVKRAAKKPIPVTAGAEPRAIIIAKPQKGFSPLAVHLYGAKSFSPQGKIISYSWDFGDGDTSEKTNPVNTYYSGSFEAQQFKVTLTVKDNKGNTSTTSSVIEVLNK